MSRTKRTRGRPRSGRGRVRTRRDSGEVIAPVREPAGSETSEPRVANARVMINPGGFGFAERIDGEGSIFLPPSSLGGAMDGDEAVVAWWPAERGPEGAVRSVVARKRLRVTGVLRRQKRRAWVEPDDPRVLGRAEVVGDAFDPKWAGQVVVGRIVDYPDPWHGDFSVTVERSLGAPGSLVTEEAKILIEHGIDPLMPPAVMKAAESVPSRVRKRDLEGRADLRDLDFMTIDPPSARDFDDAVCVQLRGKDPKRAKMRVHVAVADVSHYVRPGDPFDTEAITRGFSTYLPDRAIPMLPEQLSGGICSLVPKKDRCAMVVSFDLDASGRVSEPEVAAAVIHSKMRLSYDQVALELEGTRKLPAEIRKRILTLRAASDRLKRARNRRGSIGLDLPETKIVLDEDDPERVRAVVKSRATEGMTQAYNLIEELMVAANEVVGRIAVKHRLPVIYRVHDTPDEERVERLCAVAELLGVDADPDKLVTPKGFAAFVTKIRDHARRGALNSVTLRSLAQAEYSTHNLGHFALASGAYVHFTSPIRRYPDLVSHRVLKAWLARTGGHAGPSPTPRMPSTKAAKAAGEECSQLERQAVQAERDTKALFAAHFMRDRIGDRFEGTITGFSTNGVFVMLDDPPVDGMIKRTAVERETRQSYQMDELGARMVASKNGRDFLVGDRVVVEVLDASLQRRQIDLALMGTIGS